MTADTISRRHSAAQVPSITGLWLSPVGCRAVLVNISTTGLLAESSTRIPPSSPVKVTFEGTFSPQSVEGQVARCDVATLDAERGVVYRIGVTFAAPLDLAPGAAIVAPLPGPEIPRVPVRNRW